MAEDIQTYIREQMPVWRERHPGVEEMKVAVMGCVVNGPGESKHANIGISLPGTFEEPKAPVYVDGALRTTLRGETIVQDFLKILEDYVASHYAAAETRRRLTSAERWHGRYVPYDAVRVAPLLERDDRPRRARA